MSNPAQSLLEETTDALIERAVAGQLDAMTELLRLVGPHMAHSVRGLLGSGHPDTDDVVQQSFVALIRNLSQYRKESPLVHYASGIATRTALAAKRRQRRRHEVYATYAEANSRVSQPAEQPLTQLVRSLLTELPEEQAEALALRSVLGFSIDEIAATMQVSRNTVKSRLRLAKAALKHHLESDAKGPFDPSTDGRSR